MAPAEFCSSLGVSEACFSLDARATYSLDSSHTFLFPPLTISKDSCKMNEVAFINAAHSLRDANLS